MDSLTGIGYSIQYYTTAIWITLQIIHYVLLLILVILPLCVGIIAILFALFLSLTRALPKNFPPVSTCDGNCACRSYSGATNLPGNALLLLLLRRQRNDFLFHTPYNSNVERLLPLKFLKTLLSNYCPSRVTMEVERALIIVPPIHLSGSCAAMRHEGGLSRVRSFESSSQSRGFMQCFNQSSNNADSCNRTSSPSLKRLKYLDVSLREYTNSSQNFYKDIRPIQFKFLPEEA